MLRRLACCALLFLAAVPAAQAQTHRSGSDYSSIIPEDWTMTRPRAQERRFTSPDRTAWLSLYAAPAGRETVRDHIEKLKHHFGAGEVTYERDGSTWLVLSGYKGNRIFYRRATLACAGRAWHYLEFEYSRAEKRAFDQFVTRASYALKTYSNEGCHPA
jgi:serine/threonine-protein kinase